MNTLTPVNLIAIDPGARGGIAWNGGVIPTPTTNGDILEALRRLYAPGATAYLEHVVGFIPGGGAGAMFSFGENFGYLQGCLDALGYRVVRVRPAQWQKALQLGSKGAKIKPDKDASAESKKAAQSHNSAVDREWKTKLKSEAQRRYPQFKVTLETADALLLLEYARAQLIP